MFVVLARSGAHSGNHEERSIERGAKDERDEHH
jgi:hypothetical protein